MISRPIIGTPRTYRGHLISVHHIGPDLIARVDGQDMPNFYLTSQAAGAAAERHIDDIIKAQEKAA